MTLSKSFMKLTISAMSRGKEAKSRLVRGAHGCITCKLCPEIGVPGLVIF